MSAVLKENEWRHICLDKIIQLNKVIKPSRGTTGFFYHHMSLMDLVFSPPGCGRSATDFWGWDAHEVQLRCPDEVDGDIWIWSTRGDLKPKLY
jgi:hypothetical protein